MPGLDGRLSFSLEVIVMKPILIAGSSIVTVALVLYSISYFSFHKKKTITRSLLRIQTLALVFDITATTLMIIGSENSPFTLHGILGYSALTVMIIDTGFFWAKRKTVQLGWLSVYSTVAWVWWVAAYITGSAIAMSS